jgi:16S rRNA G1207 methylase RsmC
MTKGIGDKLFIAPIDTKKMHRVLDIGTGTGICTTFEKNPPTQRLVLTDWAMT